MTTCSKHPGVKFVTLTTKPGRNGKSLTYTGCPSCRAEKDKGGGLPPAPRPTPFKKAAKKVAAKQAPPPPKPANTPSKGGGIFARAVRSFGLLR
jgi:hypothetical protein